jgi:hypothetical protein
MGQTCNAGTCTGTVAVSSSVILFGGQKATQGTFWGDTWAFSGTGWTELAVSGPPARGAACLATLGNDKVLLYGGYDGTSYTEDTWTFDGTSWTQVMVAGPPGRSLAGMTALGDEVVLFGGYNGTSLNDTWIFDGASWSQVMSPSAPSARQAPNVATLDSGTIVLFGGNAMDGTAQDDTWTFDGSTWTEVTGLDPSPSGRTYAAMAGMGINTDVVTLFGGNDGNDMALGDTWTYGSSSDWSKETNLSISPVGRVLAAMSTIQVAAGGGITGVVLFGGDDINGSQLGDSWVYQQQWTQVTGTNPPPRDGPSMAFLP